MAEELIREFGYLGIALILILGGVGLPIPEEVPIILAAVLTRSGQMSALPAVASCLTGVLIGDFVVYFLGYCYGEKVLGFPFTRRFLTRQREAQIKGYFHRHGYKILVLGRLVPGFRSAAYLTAGILKLPTLRLLLTDVVAVSISTALMFGLGYVFANSIQKGIHETQQWLAVTLFGGVACWLLYRHERARRLAGRAVGPPVLESDEVPLPPSDDLDGAAAGPDPDPATAPAPVADATADVPPLPADVAPKAADGHPPAPVRLDLETPSPPSPSPSATR